MKIDLQVLVAMSQIALHEKEIRRQGERRRDALQLDSPLFNFIGRGEENQTIRDALHFYKVQTEKYPLRYCKTFSSLYGLRLVPSRFEIRSNIRAVLLGFESRAKIK